MTREEMSKKLNDLHEAIEARERMLSHLSHTYGNKFPDDDLNVVFDWLKTTAKERNAMDTQFAINLERKLYGCTAPAYTGSDDE